MYRNDWDAAVARATALEAQLKQAQQAQVQDHQQIAALTSQLQAARAELARLQSGMPQQMYAQPQFGYNAYPSYAYPERGGTIMVLGILSLVVCSVLGPIAWSMGNEELRRIDSGQTSPAQRGSVQAGRICGIIASVMLIFAVVMLVFMFIVIAGAESSRSY
jgi:hypothetical protein